MNSFETVKIEFPQGLFGFENCKNFSLTEAEYKPFCWLQSEDDKTLSFLVVDPFIFFDFVYTMYLQKYNKNVK